MNSNGKAAGANGGPERSGARGSYHGRLADAREIVRALRAILGPGQVTEVRALDAAVGADRYLQTYSGYFDDPEKLAAAVLRLTSARAIYFVPNPIHTGLLARAVNRIRAVRKDPTTSDGDVTRRRWLLVDADPVRPAGISSTDAEHEAALERARRVRAALSTEGWTLPLFGDSGNGGHLMYPVDLPVDDGGLVQRCLSALNARFGDAAVKIDESVFNPARVWKLYGTRAGKGDDAGEECGRPHRMARLLDVPQVLTAVTPEQLEALARSAPAEAAGVQPTTPDRKDRRAGGGGGSFDVAGWIRSHGLDVTGPEDWTPKGGGPGRKWVFKVCPWNDGHTNGSAYIVQFPSGAVEAGCHHDGCRGKDWKALRDLYEPGWDRRNGDSADANTERAGLTPSVGSIGAAPGGTPVARGAWPEPQPLPPELPPVLPFDMALLPTPFRPWIGDIAERVQCPPDFPAVAAMVALAAVVGRKVGIRPKRHDDWLVVPNLWGAVIGRPGIMKTPALQEPLRPLKRLEIKAKQAFAREEKEFEVRSAVAEARREVDKGEIKKRLQKGETVEDVTRDKLAEAEAAGGQADRPVRRRYLVNDSTVEKLGEILNENPNGVLGYRDELVGLLKSLDREGQEGARAFYLEAWNGNGRYTYDRIGRGTLDIEAAIISVIGGIQPGPLAEYQRGAVRAGAGDDGLLQRFQLSVWPDVSRGWVNVDRWPDTAARNAAYTVFERLDQLAPEEVGARTDENDPDGIPFLRCDAEAQAGFDAWRAGLEAKVRSGEEHPAIESHLAKYRSLIPSLALLIHLAEGGVGPVGAEPLKKAVQWGAYLESHARRVFSPAVTSDVGAARALANKVLKGEVGDGFALRDVYRRGWSQLSTSDEAAAGAKVLVEHDWLAEAVEKTPGRDRTIYLINPRVFQQRGDPAQPPPEATDRTDGRGDGGASVSSVSAAGGPSGGNEEALAGADAGMAGDWEEV